jgi:hypothetical protein
MLCDLFFPEMLTPDAAPGDPGLEFGDSSCAASASPPPATPSVLRPSESVIDRPPDILLLWRSIRNRPRDCCCGKCPFQSVHSPKKTTSGMRPSRSPQTSPFLNTERTGCLVWCCGKTASHWSPRTRTREQGGLPLLPRDFAVGPAWRSASGTGEPGGILSDLLPDHPRRSRLESQSPSQGVDPRGKRPAVWRRIGSPLATKSEGQSLVKVRRAARWQPRTIASPWEGTARARSAVLPSTTA